MENYNTITTPRNGNSDTSERKISPVALAIGYMMQSSVGITLLSGIFAASVVVGGSGLADLLTNYRIPSWAAVIMGIIGIPITYTIWHAPFNLVEQLEEVITDLRENNTRLKQSIGDLQVVNNDLAETNTELSTTAERLKRTEIGLQKGIQTLSETLVAGNDHQKELLTALEAVYADIKSANISGSMSKFMESLFKMDEITDELQTITSDNQDLTEQLNYSLTQLKSIIEDQRQAVLTEKINQLSHWIDREADGPNGLRTSLENASVNQHECGILLQFLAELNGLLELQQDIDHNKEKITRRIRNKNGVSQRYVSIEIPEAPNRVTSSI